MNESYTKRIVRVCRGTGCNSLEAKEIHEELIKLVQENNLSDFINIKLTGCHGFCQVGPTFIIDPDNILYVRLKITDVRDIVEYHLKRNEVIERLLYKDPISGNSVENINDIQFYFEQEPIITENCGEINPEDIEEYITNGGYESLKRVLKDFNPLEVIEEITKSGLRGRGGAGFPTGQKWLLCHNAQGNPKYLICNGDEGDPGAFMDRTILESDPHSVIEGMLIAAYAIGAVYGYVYIRAEYPLAVERFHVAIEKARISGFLGNNILDSGFNFDLSLKRGAGAFVCGEETALMASIMGKRGMPRPRPPYPATSGLWDKPTNNNNVKTYAYIPRIIKKGAKWFSSLGTQDATGTLVVALTGKVNNSGLVEVPMGTSIGKLVNEVGGGISDGKKFKAVQIGGPSGGCIPAKYSDIKMDYENITSLGSIMGSGGFIVLDENTCMVELAHYFISFTQNESCGKCVPCRIGTKKMLDLLTKIQEGKANLIDLEKLEKIADTVKKTSLCGLGQTAPNPVLTTLRYFKDEYEAHVLDKACPALVCKDLISFSIDKNKCTGCEVCKNSCPSEAISGEAKKPHSIDPDSCIKCELCFNLCPTNAISKSTSSTEKR
ncbi:MAG: NADH-ubiquinone oxidoreductase-F iron-sulfur binding region domain-containing protein [Promethearchaeota archaeon]|jgi:NADH:ubiquinone oxidoreductase subunit F (NADH-binding)/(2Fe-2S) ferredoxin/Pyruvate/2-oxoacid:ferredoxin oxidoreductase delta subunit